MSSKNKKKKPGLFKRIGDSAVYNLGVKPGLAAMYIQEIIEAIGLQEGGQIKVKRKSSKKKPRGWGAARFGK